ncbi:hypothetical protein FMM05_02060 [Flavobacterium zepuense]|uniref:Anti-sigma factor n=1 Tax=Flavobacterium zepuense TaxID=2593302 RepID=A0A552VAE1_9FLAO|nr:hypothetical protein [Flavobacterium zepuense]TRW27446.1 hypothetical protein FMM05_02060 [Flavobacterium zepuense]
MKNEKDSLDNLFDHFDGQWDTESPSLGHQERFLNRLGGKKQQRFNIKIAGPIAAAIALFIGLFITFGPHKDGNTAANKMSPKAQETQMYFAGIIQKEMAKVEKQNSPETKQLIKDALYRMNKLEDDYNNLTKELQEKGENKKIIHAMITNLQTRISFLEEVLTKIENIKKIKENYNENNQA